jgi:hypothetical protein
MSITRVLQQFLDVGFILREDIINVQHTMKVHEGAVVRVEIRLLPDLPRAPLRVPEARRGGDGLRLPEQRKVVVISGRRPVHVLMIT